MIIKKNPKVLREVFEKFILLISPFTPFMADYLWKQLGNKGYTIQQPFPNYDESLLVEKKRNSGPDKWQIKSNNQSSCRCFSG
jgi:Leucyl-tRNA synthetase